MNGDNKFFLELKQNPDAEWVVLFLEKWEKVWSENVWGVVLPEMDTQAYLQDQENMERLTHEAWKHYCEK
jgi:hypothetical protein